MSRADLHMHTSYSDGWPGPRAVVDHVRGQGLLDLIAISDHDTIEGALRAADYAAGLVGAPQVIIAEEISSEEGHILGLFVTRRVPPGMTAAATVEAIHEQGGLAVAAHPFWRVDRGPGPDKKVHGVGWKAAALDFDAIEVENATPGLYLCNQMAHRLREETWLAPLGNSDAHILDAIGRAYTTFPGQGPEAVRRAILRGETTAHRQRYEVRGLALYAAWGLHRRALKRAAARRSPSAS